MRGRAQGSRCRSQQHRLPPAPKPHFPRAKGERPSSGQARPRRRVRRRRATSRAPKSLCTTCGLVSRCGGGYGIGMQFSAQLAEEWLEHARRAGDRDAEVVELGEAHGIGSSAPRAQRRNRCASRVHRTQVRRTRERPSVHDAAHPPAGKGRRVSPTGRLVPLARDAQRSRGRGWGLAPRQHHFWGCNVRA